MPQNVEDFVGFVYLITDPFGNRYIGKKQLWTYQKMPPLKGKKRNRRQWKPMNWQSYWSSSNPIKAMRKDYPDGWKREVLHLCLSKWEMSYLESKEILQRDALLRDDYYNGEVRVHVGNSSRPAAMMYSPCRSRIRRRK